MRFDVGLWSNGCGCRLAPRLKMLRRGCRRRRWRFPRIGWLRGRPGPSGSAVLVWTSVEQARRVPALSPAELLRCPACVPTFASFTKPDFQMESRLRRPPKIAFEPQQHVEVTDQILLRECFGAPRQFRLLFLAAQHLVVAVPVSS